MARIRRDSKGRWGRALERLSAHHVGSRRWKLSIEDRESRETIEENSFEIRLIGLENTSEPEDGLVVEGTVTANRDPGYGATSRLVAEAAVCLANGDTDTPLDGGVLTPASGIGAPLIDRLRNVGMTFTVDRRTPEG